MAATTWGEMAERIRRAVRDTTMDAEGYPRLDNEGAPRVPYFSDDDLADLYNDALMDLVQYAAPRASTSVASGETSASLPSKCARVLYIFGDTTRGMLELWDPYTYDPSESGESALWYIDDTTLRFIDELQETVTVHYSEYYTQVTSATPDATELDLPRWAVPAVIAYCTAAALERKLVDDANLRRWASRTDAGGPEDNPFVDVVNHFYGRYREVIRARLVDSNSPGTWVG